MLRMREGGDAFDNIVEAVNLPAQSENITFGQGRTEILSDPFSNLSGEYSPIITPGAYRLEVVPRVGIDTVVPRYLLSTGGGNQADILSDTFPIGTSALVRVVLREVGAPGGSGHSVDLYLIMTKVSQLGVNTESNYAHMDYRLVTLTASNFTELYIPNTLDRAVQDRTSGMSDATYTYIRDSVDTVSVRNSLPTTNQANIDLLGSNVALPLPILRLTPLYFNL